MHITGGANIYLFVCVSLLIPVCPVCVCLCVISNQSTSKNHVIHVEPIIKQKNTLDVVKETRQQGMWRGEGGWTKFEKKRGVSNIEVVLIK